MSLEDDLVDVRGDGPSRDRGLLLLPGGGFGLFSLNDLVCSQNQFTQLSNRLAVHAARAQRRNTRLAGRSLLQSAGRFGATHPPVDLNERDFKADSATPPAVPSAGGGVPGRRAFDELDCGGGVPARRVDAPPRGLTEPCGPRFVMSEHQGTSLGCWHEAGALCSTCGHAPEGRLHRCHHPHFCHPVCRRRCCCFV